MKIGLGFVHLTAFCRRVGEAHAVAHHPARFAVSMPISA